MNTDRDNIYDLIIVGGGPAGSTAALYAQRAGLTAVVVDKATFPRDKICGDALSGKSVEILRDLGLWEQVQTLPGALINRIIFGSPDGSRLEIDLSSSSLSQTPEGFVVRRELFDKFMLETVKASGVPVMEGFEVTELVREGGIVCGVKGKAVDSGEEQVLLGRIVIGADGYKSTVSRATGLYTHDPKHLVVALRQYYTGVADLTDQIELHFVDEVIPGYFWIFPAGDGVANIGIGMLHTIIRRGKVDLRQALAAAVSSKWFKHRFTLAKPLEAPVGWNLPVGSTQRPNHGDGFMLVGDAAGLIDPFTGEGIGNALYSARCAVQTAQNVLASGDTTAQSLSLYNRDLWQGIGGELATSTRLQRIGRSRMALNFVVRRASKNKKVANLIAGMIANEIPREKLASPLFYLKLLFD